MLPPSGPIVAVDWAYGRFEQLSRPVGLSNEPMSDASGVGVAGDDVGDLLQDGDTSKTRTRTARARMAFMSFSLKHAVRSIGGLAEVQNGTRSEERCVRREDRER